MLTLLGTTGTGFAGPDGVGFGVAATYVAYPVQPLPAPLLLYRAADLNPANSSVTSWQNQGSLGSAYDLHVAGGYGAGPAYFGGPSPYVRFTGVEGLETASVLPLSGHEPRVLLLELYLESVPGGQHNLAGMGVPDAGRLLDLFTNDQTGDAQFGGHCYYEAIGISKVRTPVYAAPTAGSWVVAGADLTRPVANPDVTTGIGATAYSNQSYFGATASPRLNGTRDYYLDIPATTLLLGAGKFSGFNNPLPFRVRRLALYGQLSPADIIRARQALPTL